MKHVYVVLYDNFTALDAFGPVEVLNSIEELQIHYVSLHGGIIENRQGIRIETEPFPQVTCEDILLVPGGFGSRVIINDQAFLEGLSHMIETAGYVLCVCTGSALVSKTGALDGKRATSNKKAFDWVQSCRSEVLWNREARWVVDGKFYTSAGVSAGIDMALGFVGDIYGLEQAQEIIKRMEYHWNSNAKQDCF